MDCVASISSVCSPVISAPNSHYYRQLSMPAPSQNAPDCQDMYGHKCRQTADTYADVQQQSAMCSDSCCAGEWCQVPVAWFKLASLFPSQHVSAQMTEGNGWTCVSWTDVHLENNWYVGAGVGGLYCGSVCLHKYVCLECSVCVYVWQS